MWKRFAALLVKLLSLKRAADNYGKGKEAKQKGELFPITPSFGKWERIWRAIRGKGRVSELNKYIRL